MNWFSQKEQAIEYRPGPVMSQVVLADEINRDTPRTQSALLEAMQERQMTVDGVTRPMPHPFLVMETHNPVELEGTFPLPKAQVCRFLLRTVIGYPSESEESGILERFRADDPLPQLSSVTISEEIIHLTRKEEVVTITHAYLPVRYGEFPETNQEVRKVESAWKHILTLRKESLNQISRDRNRSSAKGT